MTIITSACKKEKLCEDTYFGHKVIILGHRGMGVLYNTPGNTWEAIAPVLAIGADGSELDVQLSKDSVLVLYHNDLLDGRTSCNGRVSQMNWEEIRICEYNALQPNIYVNSAEEVFARIANLQDYYFSFDCKLDMEADDYSTYQDRYIRAIQRLCEKYNMSDHVFVEGSAAFLERARELGLTNKLFLFGLLDEGTLDIAEEKNFYGLSTDLNWFYLPASAAHERNLYLMLWSPDSESENIEVLEAGADIIQTDDPISILKLLNRYNYEYVIPY